MRYRTKLLILMLAIAITPMMMMRFFGVMTVDEVSEILAEKAAQMQMQAEKERLRLVADSYSVYLDNLGHLAELALTLQAREVENVLSGPASQPDKIYFPDDFDPDQNTAPVDLFVSPAYDRIDGQGIIHPIQVSWSTPVVTLAPGLSPAGLMPDIGRLTQVLPVYELFGSAREQQKKILWYYTALESGVMIGYPGHAGIPGDLDPRKEPWYRPQSGSIEWVLPYKDPVTGKMVEAVTTPVRGPDGKPMGSTALIIPIQATLDNSLLDKNIPPASKPFVALVESGKPGRKKRLRIIAGRDIESELAKPESGAEEASWLTSGDPKGLATMMTEMTMGRRNMRRMPYQGKDSLWVYGPASPISLILITPMDELGKAAQEIRSGILGMARRIIVFSGFMLAGVVVFVVWLAMKFSTSVTRSLNILSKAGRQLGAGDFSARVSISSRDEFKELGDVFNQMAPQLLEHARVTRSLELARDIQQRLLPKDRPRIAGADIAGMSRFCDETGGDYFDFIDLGRPDSLGIAVGDVSGHGVSAALIMASVRAHLRQGPTIAESPAARVALVNDQMVDDLSTGGDFITLFYLTLDMQARQVRWVRAGHEPAVCYNPDSDTFTELGGSGSALGVVEKITFQESLRDVKPGDIIAIGTDGIWEATDSQGNMFGRSAFMETLRRHSNKPAEALVAVVFQEVEAFVSPGRIQDDVTLVIVRVLPVPDPGIPDDVQGSHAGRKEPGSSSDDR